MYVCTPQNKIREIGWRLVCVHALARSRTFVKSCTRPSGPDGSDQTSRSRSSECVRSSDTAETGREQPVVSYAHTPHLLAVSPAPHTCMEAGDVKKSALTPGSRQSRLRHAGDQQAKPEWSKHMSSGQVPCQSPKHNTHSVCGGPFGQTRQAAQHTYNSCPKPWHVSQPCTIIPLPPRTWHIGMGRQL